MRARRGAPLLALSLLALSCAPVPRPVSAPVPPSPVPGAPPTGAGPAIPTRFELHDEPAIKVGLAWDLDSLVLTPLVPVELTSAGVDRLDRFQSRSEAFVVRVQDPRYAEVADLGGRTAKRFAGIAGQETLWIGGEGAHASEARVRWAGKTWRGRLRVFLNPRGKLTLVTEVPLETYLVGVVPGEIGALSEDLIEAGRAQAVAARSYTLFYRGRRSAEGFDLFGSVEDQVYGPVESERPMATRCVERTRGLVAVSQDFPIRANYCSTCGGIAADVWEAWPTPPLPYLVSHLDRDRERDYCEASPQYRWREEWTAQEFLSNLARYGPPQGVALPAGGLGQLLDVTVRARSRSGRAWRLDVVTTQGTVEIPAYSLRQVLRRAGNASAILRSNLFKVGVRRDPRTRRALAVVVSGAGSGHGVGLCQTGAIGMARGGMRGEQILQHYYRGIELRRLY